MLTPLKWLVTKCNVTKQKDTLVINTAKGEAGAWEAGKAISIQPGLQGDILKHTHKHIHKFFHAEKPAFCAKYCYFQGSVHTDVTRT